MSRSILILPLEVLVDLRSSETKSTFTGESQSPSKRAANFCCCRTSWAEEERLITDLLMVA